MSARIGRLRRFFKAMMIGIGRITTVYDEVEDRVSLTGAGQSGEVYRGWLTRRLFDLLLEQLFVLLGPPDADGYAQIKNEFAQEQAEASLSPQKPVTSSPDGVDLGPFLIIAIDISEQDGIFRLSFRHAPSDGIIIPFSHQDLRQWLSIARRAYQKAQWPMQGWPKWMTPPESSGTKQALLH